MTEEQKLDNINETHMLYSALREAFDSAFEQAAFGKGAERHANALPFTEQPIFTIAKLVGPGFNAGQVIKKTQEALAMMDRGQSKAAQREFAGVMVYAASLWLMARDQM